MAILVLGCVAIVLSVYSPFQIDRNGRDNQETRFYPHDDGLQAKKDKALQKMQTIAAALREYRNTQGDGARFPATLTELSYFGFLDEDFDFSGPLTDEPMPFRSMIPAGEDPSRWAICIDVQLTTTYNNYGRRVKEVDLAAVILGDGTATVLTGEELRGYGGMEAELGQAR